MKIGKIPENILERSVFKIIKHRRDEVIVRPGVGLDCTHMAVEDGYAIVLSTDPITGSDDMIGTLAVNVTANDIASSGAEPIGIMVSALLPKYTKERVLKEIMNEIEGACSELNIEVMGGHTEVTEAVAKPLLTITGVGKIKKDRIFDPKKIEAGMDVVMTKWAGVEGTAIIAAKKKEDLLSRYTEEFVDGAINLMDNISIVKDAKIAFDNGALLMHDVTEGGVYGALWEVASAAGKGIEVDLKKIPIKQETVEVCEFFDLNPYMLISSGSLMIVANHGNLIVDELEKAGIHACVIGRITDGNERIVKNETEIRYLEPASTDELYKVK
ncbi:MAG: AIR synthase family protein [Lachnospiraceae bacterium]|nr:AIR synthase family protein [Lachnospiraceae bacterium]